MTDWKSMGWVSLREHEKKWEKRRTRYRWVLTLVSGDGDAAFGDAQLPYGLRQEGAWRRFQTFAALGVLWRLLEWLKGVLWSIGYSQITTTLELRIENEERSEYLKIRRSIAHAYYKQLMDKLLDDNNWIRTADRTGVTLSHRQDREYNSLRIEIDKNRYPVPFRIVSSEDYPVDGFLDALLKFYIQPYVPLFTERPGRPLEVMHSLRYGYRNPNYKEWGYYKVLDKNGGFLGLYEIPKPIADALKDHYSDRWLMYEMPEDEYRQLEAETYQW